MQPNTFYHIYNRANGNEVLYLSDENAAFFLRRYEHFVAPWVDTFCYCLMPNHFHFLIRTKNRDVILNELERWKNQDPEGFLERFPKLQTLEILKTPEGIEKFLSKQFSNLFSSYTLAFNKQQGRMGSLFMKNFKRKEIYDEQYLKNLVVYIHNNPVEAYLCKRPEDWQFSSYEHILSARSIPQHQEVIDWFGDSDNFKARHWLQSA